MSAFFVDGLKIDNLTIEDTELGKIKPIFEAELEKLKTQPPFIHDIKLEVNTQELYEKLVKNKATPNKQNKGITLGNFQIFSKVTVKATVYPDGLLLVHLGCTHQPIPYSLKGWLQVDSICSQVMILLQGLANDLVFIPPSMEWLVTHYHFNKDGIILDSPLYHYSIANLAEHSQTYVKKLKNGKTVLRYEEKISPNKTLEELANVTPNEEQYSQTFDVASELYD